MAIHDFASQRLMVDAPLAPGADIELDREQTNYLLNTLFPYTTLFRSDRKSVV